MKTDFQSRKFHFYCPMYQTLLDLHLFPTSSHITLPGYHGPSLSLPTQNRTFQTPWCIHRRGTRQSRTPGKILSTAILSGQRDLRSAILLEYISGTTLSDYDPATVIRPILDAMNRFKELGVFHSDFPVRKLHIFNSRRHRPSNINISSRPNNSLRGSRTRRN